MENIAINSSAKRKGVDWQATSVSIFLLLLIALAVWMIASQVVGNLAQSRQEKAIAVFEEETGIRVLRIVLTAGGGIVDFQYQVVDPDKALIVHDVDNPPMMIDVKHNLILANPFHEHADRELHTAVTYHEMIMNGAGLLQRGSKITLIVGASKLENLIVQ